MTDWLADRRRVIWLILGLAVFLFFFRLGDRPLRNPDEGRYAHIAGEMAAGQSWLEPKLFGIDYLRKPPLFYWLLAASFKAFGPGEWQARMVPALFGLAAVLATYFFSRRFFGSRPAAFAALFLLVNPWHLQVSRFLVIDAVFSFFVVASLYLFFLAFSAERRKTLLYAGFYAAVAMAFLAKGILAIVFPGIPIFLYVLWKRRLVRTLLEMNLLLGITLFALVVVPWFYWMSVEKPEFWKVFFFREHLSRFTAENFEHQEGWWFYPVLMLAFFMPWLLVPGAMREAGRTARTDTGSFLLLWAGAAVLFLSISKSKLATYLMPVIPPVCIVLGDAYARWTEDKPKRFKLYAGVLSLFMIAVVPVSFIMEHANVQFTSKHFAEVLKPRLAPGDAVYVYDHPGPFYDFSFYLGRPVRPVGLFGELEITQDDENARKVALSKEEFFTKMEEGREHFYCLMRRSDWRDLSEAQRAALKLLYEDKRKVLFESGEKS